MEKMTAEAWMFMLTVWSIIITATVYSFYKLLTSKRKIGTPAPDEEFPNVS